MSILLDKSKGSTAAALLLRDQSLYASSVHCAYYSCIQLVSHILINDYGVDGMKAYRERKNPNEGSHEALIHRFIKELLTDYPGEGRRARDIRNDVFQLKEKRTDADYKEIEITKPINQVVIDKAAKINQLIKSCYKI